MERVVEPGGLAAPDHRLRKQMRRLQLSPQPRETLTTYTYVHVATCSCMSTYNIHVLLIMRDDKEGRKKQSRSYKQGKA